MKKQPCPKCGDTGTIDTGNNDLPCDCPNGDKALFNVAGAKGPVTGAEVKRHCLNGSPEPRTGPIDKLEFRYCAECGEHSGHKPGAIQCAVCDARDSAKEKVFLHMTGNGAIADGPAKEGRLNHEDLDRLSDAWHRLSCMRIREAANEDELDGEITIAINAIDLLARKLKARLGKAWRRP